jgi:dihydroorotate dehydrogenase
MYWLLRKVLFMIDAEMAHHLTLEMASAILRIPGMPRLWGCLWPAVLDPWEGLGLQWPNRVGLAAGFDKDARYLRVWKAMGFGSVEVGTLTPRPQNGNPRPRLFRLVKDNALINRLGFNNRGVTAAVSRLRHRPAGLVVGANIGKNKNTPNELAMGDYLTAFEQLHPWVDYFTINLSSPNTPGLRELQEAGFIDSLLKHIYDLPCQQVNPRPVCIKLAPDMEPEQWRALWPVLSQHRVAGLVLTNTTIERRGLRTSPKEIEQIGQGGLSGAPLAEMSLALLKAISEYGKAQGFLPALVSVGGILNGPDAAERMQSGASWVQVYTGLVYRGPVLVGEAAAEIRGAYCSKA